MSRLFYHVMQDNAGNLLFDVSGTMRIAGTGTVATIYGDEALTVILPNPMTNHASFGSFKCFLGAGDYDFYMAKSGYNFETLTGVQGHGTMAQQDASAVAITGGSASFTGNVAALQRTGDNQIGFYSLLQEEGVLTRYALYCQGTARTRINGSVGLKREPSNHTLEIAFPKSTSSYGIALTQDADTGTGNPVLFVNAASSIIGSISTTGSATAYNTTSDARLKKMIEMFDGALDLVHQLRPVRFRWRTDDSEGNGFLANEVKQVLDGVVTGEPDAMNEDGSVNPQQIDHSKLVPLLTAALKELSGQVQTLTARVHELELLSVS